MLSYLLLLGCEDDDSKNYEVSAIGLYAINF